MQLFAVKHGLDANLAFYSVRACHDILSLDFVSPHEQLAIINASGFFGRIIANHLADSIGPVTMLIPAAFCTSLSIWLILAMWVGRTSWLFGLHHR
jgi:hypothetical protein